MALIFEPMRAGGDNLTYLVGCSQTREAAVIDPTSAHDILDFCDTKNLSISYVLNTHGHPDHTGGNEVIASATGAVILAHARDRAPGVGEQLEDDDVLELGKIDIEVIHTPGHTPGGLCFKINNKLLTGDTVFLSGCGNTRFGGDVGELFASFDQKINPLSGRVEVWPGHDYAETNLRFARTVEPDNHAIDLKLKKVKDASRGGWIIKSTLAEERRYNPFFRCKKTELIESLRAEYPELPAGDPFQTFKLLRELRNNW